MKVISWNTNGLRATAKQGFFTPLFTQEKPDVLCLQEIKADADQLPDEVRNVTGYFSFFSSSKNKKGYSGVALYCKEKPKKVFYGIGEKRFDDEGRIIGAEFSGFVIFSVYFPNGGSGPDRLKYKLEFYEAFLKFIDKIKISGKKIIFCGDVNTAHEAIDLARPKANEKNTGFLPIERAWIDKVIKHGYIDVFRYLYPNKKKVYTYWDMKTFSRNRNVGWRLDYFFVSPDLLPKIKDSKMISDYYGSDHCPITLELK